MNIFDQISRRFDPYRQRIFVETNGSRRYIEKKTKNQKQKKSKRKLNEKQKAYRRQM